MIALIFFALFMFGLIIACAVLSFFPHIEEALDNFLAGDE